MSDLAGLRHVTPARCQLPVSWYFDPAIFAREKELLFKSGPNYIGHELMVPNPGDFHTLAWMDHAKMLRGDLEVEVFKENRIGREFYRRYGFTFHDEHIHEETGEALLRLVYSENNANTPLP